MKKGKKSKKENKSKCFHWLMFSGQNRKQYSKYGQNLLSVWRKMKFWDMPKELWES